MVEYRSPKPLIRVQLLLPLPEKNEPPEGGFYFDLFVDISPVTNRNDHNDKFLIKQFD